ncbi:MAG: hypothetical protein HC836_47885 [Richelia sp. RM2_1_2]|nr:hypothetical protein [Richelia sp. SM2_1_7]NJM23781.1 hypothetical protein [Richelia sp. SM1_7_0]NJN13759.1 hypothetical protein [Richelia sp. RM1_1_1]NJO31184.1 hypothetical protein [Richelia sp. SL_2_1]NJO65548.1 hypothetical protein [Richelia sp. RM2_1_2]
MKRDIQGKFALKNDDYRRVRSLRITDDTWKELGIASECLGMTRADYLEEMVRKDFFPRSTWENSEIHPSITRYEEEIDKLQVQILNLQKENSAAKSKTVITFFQEVVDMPAIRDHILFELKLGRQASGYRAAKKALNRLIAELKRMAETLD